MSKPVSAQDLFELWQKMVNPGAYPLQSLMFPALDPKEIERRIAELEIVEHWLRANLNMLQLSIKSLEFQRDLLKGGEKVARAAAGEEAPAEVPNPAMWAWNLMAQAGKEALEASAQPAKSAATGARPRRGRKPGG